MKWKSNSDNFQESDSDTISHGMRKEYFFIDCIELSELLDINELTTVFDVEKPGLEESRSQNGPAFGGKDDSSPFESLISDFLETSDVIVLKCDVPEEIEKVFEYKLLKLFYFCGFPIVGIPLNFLGEKEIKPMLFFVGCKDRDDKLVSVVDYYLKML